MAINPIDTVTLEREEPPGAGDGVTWVTTDVDVMARNVTLTIRAMFTTDNIGGSESSGNATFQRRDVTNGGAWTDMTVVLVVVKDTWYELETNWAGFSGGQWEMRFRIEHPTGTGVYLSNDIDILQLGIALWVEKEKLATAHTEKTKLPTTSTEKTTLDPPTTWGEKSDTPATTQVEANKQSVAYDEGRGP